ncbi:RidA family protein [Enterococcus alcedinis]|uniref:RidA family protein n=1 Tax=Enterococcus alcedinis TaxID=1274384 RepID=A0A917N3M2_9ENTE|nr:RidA family protein [Enterococcus alcedinis]MBP2101048.1 2-iminobutanoate/2-iminopropanoate deaminase [Enterococcus alcedinis]GGI64653.1 RidA family protein [Enterococcus alcedinis]
MNIKPITTNGAPGAIGPYSQAIQIGELVYTSGQLPVNPTTGMIPEGVKEQAKQSLENVQAILESTGTSMEKVFKTTIFIKDMNDFVEINEVYSQFFKEPFPARSCVEVARLPKDVKVEIEVIATL